MRKEIMQALQQLGLCDGIYTGLYHELFGLSLIHISEPTRP